MNERIPKYTVTLRASFGLLSALSHFLAFVISNATNMTFFYNVHSILMLLLGVTSISFYSKLCISSFLMVTKLLNETQQPESLLSGTASCCCCHTFSQFALWRENGLTFLVIIGILFINFLVNAALKYSSEVYLITTALNVWCIVYTVYGGGQTIFSARRMVKMVPPQKTT